MFEVARAQEIIDELHRLEEATTKIVGEELDLYKHVGASGPATPEGVAIAGAKLMITEMVKTINILGTTLAELLLDEQQARDLGISD